MSNEWEGVPWYCPNCGKPVRGWRTNEGRFKAECAKCRTVTVRVIKNRKNDVIHVFAPEGLARITV